MFEYEVMAKKRMREFHRQAQSDHRAHLAASDQKTGRREVGRILVRIGKAFVAAYRLIVRRPRRSMVSPPGIPARVE